MPPKTMNRDAIVELVQVLLKKANVSECKSKKRVTKWGNESEDEEEMVQIEEIGESSKSGKKEVMDKYQKVFLDVLRSSNRNKSCC